MDVGYAIRFLRKQKGYTQAQLADFAYTTKSTISNLENGSQGYSPALLNNLAKALECSVSQIFIIAENSDKSKIMVDDLPIDVLYALLNKDMQRIVLQLVRQMVKDSNAMDK